MLIEKNFLNLLYLGSKNKRSAGPSSYVRAQLTGLITEYGRKRAARKTTDLIRILLSHGARAARSSQPRARIAINVFQPDGQRAIRIKMRSLTG